MSTVASPPGEKVATHAPLPSDYQALPRGDKEALLWQKVLESEYSTGALPDEWPGPVDMLKLTSTRHDRVSLDLASDEMPPGRVKLLHRYGSVARFEWRAHAGHGYTGIFRTGGSGLARVSRAVKSLAMGLPGMALKVFIDGRPSVNIFAMPSADRDWTDQNPFSLPYANIIEIGSSRRGQFLRAIFNRLFAGTIRAERARDLQATFLPLDGMTKITPDGADVAEPAHPELVIFEPTAGARLSAAREPDFRLTLGELEAGTTLLTICAARTRSSPPEPVGELVITSPFVASRYSDEVLFFQHDRGPTLSE